jgi:hypothetical protein
MLLLKMLMEVFWSSPESRAMVRNTNDSFILKDCLERAQWAFGNSLESSQIFIVKAFIEFVAMVYANKTAEILQCVQGLNVELESYLLARLL